MKYWFLKAVVGLSAFAAAAPLHAQDRAAELEARRAARAQERTEPGWQLDAELARLYPWAFPRSGGPYDRARPGEYGGHGSWRHPGTPRIPVYGYPYGAGSVHGYPLPNPYTDWARTWGRGWLDGASLPPYHRFQYRFFPETLPDPTVSGYVEPRLPPGALPDVIVQPIPAGTGCVRVEVVAEGGAGERASDVVLIGLPSLGASTREAFRAVVHERLRRGAGVVVRDLDGYVYRFPDPGSVDDIVITDC